MKNIEDEEKAKLINLTIDKEQSEKLVKLNENFNCSKKSKIIRYLIENFQKNKNNKKNIKKYIEQVRRKDLEQWRKQRKEPGKFSKTKLNVSLYKRQRDIAEKLVKKMNLTSKSQLIRVLIDSQFEQEEGEE